MRDLFLPIAVVVILGVSVLTGCRQSNITPGDPDWPQANPSPQHFLLVHGTIDSSLDIVFRSHWLAQNNSCKYAASLIEGAFAPYGAWTPLTVARQDADFAVRVPIDGVLPGRCQWTFSDVRFAGRRADGRIGFSSPFIQSNSYPLSPGQSPNGATVLRCAWTKEPGNVEGEDGIQCREEPKSEDAHSSVLGGVLWWHPTATDFEAHFVEDTEHW